MDFDNRPIGVFDSGVGGLTVLKGLLSHLPHENWVYLGDTARLPFGTKSPDTIRNYTEQNLKFLASKNCKAFIIACNSASTQFQQSEFMNIPVFNVIDPGVEAALDGCNSEQSKIGIIGTRATINSEIYVNKLTTKGFKGQILTQACPLFVPLVEEGETQGPICKLVVEKYLQNFKLEHIDSLILACTHYPLLKEEILAYFGYDLKFITSEFFLAKRILEGKVILNKKNTQKEEVEVLTTDDFKNVESLVKKMISKSSLKSISTVDLRLILG